MLIGQTEMSGISQKYTERVIMSHDISDDATDDVLWECDGINDHHVIATS